MRFAALLALALLPLQWFAVAPSPIGELRMHQLAMFGLTACVIATYGFARIGSATRRLQFFIIASLYMLILTTAMDLYNGVLPIQPIQSLLYVVSFVAISAYFYMAASDPRSHIVDALRWSAVVTVVTLITAFGLSLLKNGINPLTVIQQTIVTADPSVLTQQLFGKAFVGFGFDLETTQVQIRHEVFGGMLLSMYIASWAKARRPFTVPKHLFYYRAAMVIGTMLVLLSLSRAVTLAALVWPAILLARAILSGRVSGAQLAGVMVSFIGLGAVAASGFLGVVWGRFTEDTRGYVGRSENIADAIDRIFDNFWTGGFATATNSSHNFILDNFQRAGVLVAIPVIIVFLYIFGVWASLLVRIRTLPMEMLPVAAALALPVFRMMTQGGGQISVNGWMTLAFVTGVVQAAYTKERAAQHKDNVGLPTEDSAALPTVDSGLAKVEHAPAAIHEPVARPGRPVARSQRVSR